MPKGQFLAEFELYLLLAMTRLGETAYGVTIRQEIEERTGRPVSIGAVYATLGRLGDKGLVDFRESDPTPVRGGRSRKFYHLTPAGKKALLHSTTMLARMMDGVQLNAELKEVR
ncbi:MAG: helix-turn-helix transcriptional regulator [Myxococcota bacterium]|nr:helix-turn-helix transcriptional regulator [Myxococcota bacterium]